MRKKAFLGLRIIAFLALMLMILGFFISGARSSDMLFFSILGLLWFGSSILFHHLWLQHHEESSLANPVLAMLDAYVLLSALAFCSSSLIPSVITLGVYVALATAIGGWIVGLIAVVAAFLGCFNAWIIDTGNIIRVVVTGFVAFMCGYSWRICVPIIWKGIGPHVDSVEDDELGESETDTIEVKLAAMQKQLEMVSGERDQVLEDIAELQQKLAAATSGDTTDSEDKEKATEEPKPEETPVEQKEPEPTEETPAEESKPDEEDASTPEEVLEEEKEPESTEEKPAETPVEEVKPEGGEEAAAPEDIPAGETPAETPETEEPKPEETPVEQKEPESTEETPAETPPTEEPVLEEKPAEEKAPESTEETAETEETPAEEPKAEKEASEEKSVEEKEPESTEEVPSEVSETPDGDLDNKEEDDGVEGKDDEKQEG